MTRAPKGWQFLDEVEPPKGESVLVWNGETISVAKLQRGRFVAHAEGIPVCDPWEKPVILRGVTHWHPLPKAPQ
jgi:hypothetical protein